MREKVLTDDEIDTVIGGYSEFWSAYTIDDIERTCCKRFMRRLSGFGAGGYGGECCKICTRLSGGRNKETGAFEYFCNEPLDIYRF
ncbi:MAG: hypothetical protein LBL98_08500 [Ruminococcus sp.]|jgi:hypothetical protein|nr:hypothetical protein [Ruminococcus sp.]